MPRNSQASRVGRRRRPPPWRAPESAHGAHEESSSSRGATVTRSGSPARRRARTRPSGSSTTAAIAGRRWTPRRAGHGPAVTVRTAADAEPLEHDRVGGLAQAAGGVLQRDLQSGHAPAAPHPERERERVAGDGPRRRDAPVDLQPPRAGQHEDPGEHRHRGERQGDEVELPRAEHPRRHVGRDGDGEERDSPGGRPGHRPGPGTGTASRRRAITASSACVCAPASDARMMR